MSARSVMHKGNSSKWVRIDNPARKRRRCLPTAGGSCSLRSSHAMFPLASRILLIVWMPRAFLLSAKSGSSTRTSNTFRQSCQRSTGSNSSGRFVSPNTKSLFASFAPSFLATIWFTTESCTPQTPPSRIITRRPGASPTCAYSYILAAGKRTTSLTKKRANSSPHPPDFECILQPQRVSWWWLG